MGKVIQVKPDDWWTLLMIKNSIKFYEAHNDKGQYDISLRKEKELLAECFDTALGRNPDANSIAA